MFYTHDARKGDVAALTSHERDRVSMTVVLEDQGSGYQPEAVMYHGHRPWHILSMSADACGSLVSPLLSWMERVVLPWRDVEWDASGPPRATWPRDLTRCTPGEAWTR